MDLKIDCQLLSSERPLRSIVGKKGYIYPKEHRAVRDLLRRRLLFCKVLLIFNLLALFQNRNERPAVMVKLLRLVSAGGWLL